MSVIGAGTKTKGTNLLFFMLIQLAAAGAQLHIGCVLNDGMEEQAWSVSKFINHPALEMVLEGMSNK
jgi:hypothetical protein